MESTGADTGTLEARSPLHTLEANKLFYVAAGSVHVTLGSDEREVVAGGHV